MNAGPVINRHAAFVCFIACGIKYLGYFQRRRFATQFVHTMETGLPNGAVSLTQSEKDFFGLVDAGR